MRVLARSAVALLLALPLLASCGETGVPAGGEATCTYELDFTEPPLGVNYMSPPTISPVVKINVVACVEHVIARVLVKAEREDTTSGSWMSFNDTCGSRENANWLTTGQSDTINYPCSIAFPNLDPPATLYRFTARTISCRYMSGSPCVVSLSQFQEQRFIVLSL